MGINECSKPASKSSWDSQDFGDVNMVLKMVHFRKSSRPQWVNGITVYKLSHSILYDVHHYLLHHNLPLLFAVGWLSQRWPHNMTVQESIVGIMGLIPKALGHCMQEHNGIRDV